MSGSALRGNPRVSGALLGAALTTLLFTVAPLAYARATYHLYDLPKEIVFTLGVWLLLALLVLWRGVRGEALRLPVEVVLLGAHGVGAAAALCLADHPGEGVDLVRRGLLLGACWILGCLVLGSARALRLFLGGVALSGLLVALIGLSQHRGIDHWRDAEGALRPFARLAGNDGPAAVFGHVNFAAHFVALGFLALVGLGLPALLRRGLVGRVILAPLLAAPLGVEGLYLLVTGTRSVWISVPVAAAFGVALHLKSLGPGPARRRILLGASGLVIAAALLLLVLDPLSSVQSRGGEGRVRLSERLTSLLDPDAGSLRERRVLWSNTWALATDHPWLGVGPGNWKLRYPAVARRVMVHEPGTFRVDRQPEHVHHDALQVLAETGWLGFLPLLAFIAFAFLRLVRTGLGRERRVQGPAATAAACVAAVLLISLVSFPFQKATTGAIAFALLGAGATLGRREGHAAVRLSPWVALAAVLVIAGASALSLHARFVGGRAYVHAKALTQAATSGAQDRTAMPLTDAQLLARALDQIDIASAREPGNHRYLIHRAQVLRLLGRWDQAAAVLERALDLHPHLVNALMLRASLLPALGQHTAALALLEEARRILPDAHQVHLARARIYNELGLRGDSDAMRRAAEAYLQAIGDREWAPVPRLLMARLLLHVGAPTDRIIALLTRAEQDASRDPGLLADCAKLYGDPRLGVVSALFGPAGAKPLELWRRVSDLSRGLDQEAVMHVSVEPLKRFRAGAASRPTPQQLVDMRAKVSSFVVLHPDELLARYFHAQILELVDEPEGALVEWGNLARRVMQLGPSGRALEWVVAEATQASIRLREQLEVTR